MFMFVVVLILSNVCVCLLLLLLFSQSDIGGVQVHNTHVRWLLKHREILTVQTCSQTTNLYQHSTPHTSPLPLTPHPLMHLSSPHSNSHPSPLTIPMIKDTGACIPFSAYISWVFNFANLESFVIFIQLKFEPLHFHTHGQHAFTKRIPLFMKI